MRKYLNLFGASLFALLILTQCKDDYLANEGQESNETISVSSDETDLGVKYLNQLFYIKSSDNRTSGMTRSGNGVDVLNRAFYVNVDQAGEYYLGAHVLPANVLVDNAEKLQDIQVYVNSEYVGELALTKAEWEFTTIKGDLPIYLNAGGNNISFTSEAPYYPEIDAIQTEKTLNALLKVDQQYEEYLSYLKSSNSLTTDKAEQEIVEKEQIEMQGAKTRSAINPGNWSWQVTPVTYSNPGGNYQHKMNVPITYTYHRKLSLAKGTYTFKTAPVEGDTQYSVDPVMYLYKVDDPHNYSYVNDDYSGLGRHSQITASLPAGDYYILVRAYSSSYSTSTTGRQGLIDVYQNNVKINTNAPVAGYSVDVDSPNTGTINYFTAYSTGIPEFFLEEKVNNKAKFFGSTYFYASPMEQMWWDDARVRLTKPSSSDRYRMIITACGAFGAYYGNCDVYGSCIQVESGSNIMRSFPNLQLNDAIYSGTGETNVYNCASWAGGLTTGWTWGGIYSSVSGSLSGTYYGNPYVWQTWDDFFGNNPARYSGATTYTRNDAHSGNGEIAVWSTNGAISGATHFSVRGTANKHPHGYAWESKPGGLRRIFHPRDAVRGSTYGEIFAYYRDASKDPYGSVTRSFSIEKSDEMTFEESIEKGLTVVEKVELTPAQTALFVTKTRSSGSTKVNQLYDAWAKVVSTPEYMMMSNPYSYFENKEAAEFIDYCKNNKAEAMPFFVNLYFSEESGENVQKEVSYYMFCNIFEEYASMMESVKEEWKANPKAKSGAYVAPLPETFTKKYAKEIINKMYGI